MPSPQGARIMQALDAEMAEPLMIFAVRPDGVFRMVLNPKTMVFFRDEEFRDDLIREIGECAKKMAETPMDDLELF